METRWEWQGLSVLFGNGDIGRGARREAPRPGREECVSCENVAIWAESKRKMGNLLVQLDTTLCENRCRQGVCDWLMDCNLAPVQAVKEQLKLADMQLGAHSSRQPVVEAEVHHHGLCGKEGVFGAQPRALSGPLATARQ